jgi:hypothetical protein
MKKFLLGTGMIALFFCSFGFGQEVQQHEAIAVNIEVPVRVYKGDAFMDHLKLEDFQVWEDGVIQKVDAVYLIKKTSVERKDEAEKKFRPQVARNFVLLFEIHEYLPKVGEAIDYFFKNVIVPGDSLTVITPLRTYNCKKEAMEKLPSKVVSEQLKGKLKLDTKMGSTEYNHLLREIENVLVSTEWDEMKYQMAKDLLSRLEKLRYVNEQKLLGFADYLKEKTGQKYVFMFYQKELLPKMKQFDLATAVSELDDRQDIIFHLQDLNDYYYRDVTFDVDKVKKAFADSSISIHFLFITKPRVHDLDIQNMRASGMEMREQSEDVFNAFQEVANSTGGLTDNSADASFAFKRAVEASENYYLLYYTPKSYKSDGEFRVIKVQIKGKKYKILHRAGYVSN